MMPMRTVKSKGHPNCHASFVGPVCVCVHVHVCVSIHMYVCINVCINVCMYVCTYVIRPNSPAHTIYYVLAL
jgi:hypothetical protein